MGFEIGQLVTFKDNPACSGVIFEFQDDGMVAGLRSLSEKLIAMGVEGETHEPTENLDVVDTGGLKVGDVAYMKSDGQAFYGTIFEFQDGGMVAGMRELSDKIKGLGCG